MDKDTAKKGVELVSTLIDEISSLDGRTTPGRRLPGLLAAHAALKKFSDSIDNKSEYKPSRFVSSDSKEAVRELFRIFLSSDKRDQKVTITLSRADVERYMRAISDVLYFTDSSGT